MTTVRKAQGIIVTQAKRALPIAQMTTVEMARVMMASSWLDTPKIGQIVDKFPWRTM